MSNHIFLPQLPLFSVEPGPPRNSITCNAVLGAYRKAKRRRSVLGMDGMWRPLSFILFDLFEPVCVFFNEFRLDPKCAKWALHGRFKNAAGGGSVAMGPGILSESARNLCTNRRAWAKNKLHL